MRRIQPAMLLCFAAAMLAMECRAEQPTAVPAGIPAGAVKAADGYRYTDPQGRQWVYRPTPFGIARIPAADASASKAARAAAAAGDLLRATDHGDTVSFERPGPFGVYRWERKKSEMDATERAAFERLAAAGSDRK
jgi:hypothetical protein